MSEAWCFDSFHDTQYTEAGIQTVKVELLRSVRRVFMFL